MNVFDGILLIILAGCSFVGLFKGFTKTVFSLGSVFIGLWIAPRLAEPVAGILQRSWSSEVGTQVLGFVISFLIIVGLVMLAGKTLSKILKKLELGWIDRLAGVLLGAYVGVLAGGLLVYLVGLGINPDTTFWKDASSKRYFVSIFRATVQAIPREFEKRWEEKKERLKDELRDAHSEIPEGLHRDHAVYSRQPAA